jgi:hypothetical protein
MAEIGENAHAGESNARRRLTIGFIDATAPSAHARDVGDHRRDHLKLATGGTQ